MAKTNDTITRTARTEELRCDYRREARSIRNTLVDQVAALRDRMAQLHDRINDSAAPRLQVNDCGEVQRSGVDVDRLCAEYMKARQAAEAFDTACPPAEDDDGTYTAARSEMRRLDAAATDAEGK